jgi:hypothetical protein
MNFRVFLLIGATAAFGGLLASDGRYQSEQVTLARIERARSRQVPLAFYVGRRIESARHDMVPNNDRMVTASQQAQAAAKVWAILSAANSPVSVEAQPIPRQTVVSIPAKSPIAQLVVVWILGVDPGDGIGVLTDGATLAKTRLEERFCLLRYCTRQAAYSTERRAAAFLRAQLAEWQRSDRLGRIVIREIPIEETRAPATGQTR